MSRGRRKRNKDKRRPVKVPDTLHSALLEMQREFKKHRGEEPALGDLVEKAFEEDPALEKVLTDNRKDRGGGDDGSVWNEDFMKL